MMVYRNNLRRIRTNEALRRVEAAAGFERLMELGELEAGVADALFPTEDGDDPVLHALRRGEWHGLELPEEIEISVPEGFAYYALDPELYRIAARRFAAECRPARVAAIGIRSIGTTLSAIVEGELRQRGVETASWTVRPRGHPWNRTLRVADDLARAWRAWNGWFAVVDEGPGLSGSSFAAVAGFLASLGVPDGRIVLFPSWCPDGSSFLSAAARERWRRHARYTAAFEDLGLFGDAEDLSSGRWRSLCLDCPAVQPQHERRKYRRGGLLYKFAGYGRYGRALWERARALEGFVPRPSEFQRGFLAARWVSGRPARLGGALIEHAARYLAVVRREFALGDRPLYDPLAEMIAANTGRPPDPRRWRGIVDSGRPVMLDARTMPHEWLETTRGYVKMDALEHHDDHFYPGPQDTAWDLAAFSVEWNLDRGALDYLTERYRRASGDREIALRLPFYRLAYLAFRLGYSEMAAGALDGSAEAGRWRAEKTRYASLLEDCQE